MMNNLNTIPIVGKFTDVAAAANNNFTAIKAAIDMLELNTTRSKGFFSSASALSTMYPSPVVGDWAVVQDTSVSPATVYIWRCTTNGTWSNSGTEWPGGNVELSEYAKKTELPDIEDDLTIEVTGKALDARQGFVLAGQIGKIDEKLSGKSALVAKIVGKELHGKTADMNRYFFSSGSGAANYTTYIFDVTHLVGESVTFYYSGFNNVVNYQFLKEYQQLIGTTSSNPVDVTDLLLKQGGNGSTSTSKHSVTSSLTDSNIVSHVENGGRVYLLTQLYNTFEQVELKINAGVEGDIEELFNEINDLKSRPQIEVDSELVDNSDNPVAGGAVKEAIDNINEKLDDYDGSLVVDRTVTSPVVTITNGIANKLISANSGLGNRGFWSSPTNGRSWIYDVTSEVGKSINITYWNRANTRRYIFVPDISLLKTSDPGAELWPTMYISLGVKASSTTSYNPQTAMGVIVPPPVTAAGDSCEKVYLIVSGYYVSADSESNIIPKVVVPENAYVRIPKKTSQLENDSGFITEESLQNDDGDLTPVYTRSSGLSANSANSYKGFWRSWNYSAISSASNVAKSNVFDVTEKVGKKLSIVAWRRANARIYAFVTDYTLITTSVPSDEDWADMFISGARSTSTVSDPYHVQVTVPEPKTEGGSVYLIVMGLYVDATSKYNITARAIDPDDAEIIIPRKTSQLENDSGFITTDQGTGIMALNPKKDFLLRVKNMVHHFYNGTHQVTPLLLAHFSDIHGNGRALERMLEWCGEFDTYIDDIIHTGDCVTGKYSDGLAFWDNVEDSEKILNITGNHDYSTTGDGSGGMSATDVYQLLFVGDDSENPRIANWRVVQPDGAGTVNYNAWYKDYTSKKVRLIGLDCMKRNAEQLAWFKTVLADAANKSLTVVIGFHSSPLNTNSELVKCPFTGMYNGSMGAYSWASAVTAVDDFKAGTLEGQERAGDFACWLGGHSHKDTVYWVNGSQLSIVVDSMTAGISGRNRLVSTDDKSQDCFNLVAIDTYWKTVKLLRVGNDTDDQLRKIDQCAIKYTTGEVL